MSGKNAKKKKEGGKTGPATIQNRRASFEYHFEETIEAGMVLEGSEAKSLFLGRAHLTDAYCMVKNEELWLCQLDIEPYEYSKHFQPERRRDRKLLVHRKEIDHLQRQTEVKGLTLVPTKVYFKNGRAKVLIAVARGKKLFDKRESEKEKAQKRDFDRDFA